MDFFKNLNFSSANEDGATEIAALGEASKILCITGSGTRPLDLLMTDAAEVIAFDVNPAQNALLSLKIAAIKSLSYREFLTFIGVTSGDRSELYQRVRAHLGEHQQAYWDARSSQIRKGLWYAGKWEKLLFWNAKFLRLFRGKSIDALMNAPTLEHQSQIWRDVFADGWMRKFVELTGRDWIWQRIIGEPGGAFLPTPRETGQRFEDLFDSAAQRFLFRDSDFATLIFKGHHDPDAALPVHLRSQNYDRLRAGLGRLRIVEGHLTALPDLNLGQIDGFSLSDFGSYCDVQAYTACWQGIVGTAAPGAAFCERVFMNDMALPLPALQLDRPLSDRLTQQDRSIIYDIRAGRILRA
ncbi:DUF3419 family protein [Algirhabdus cladophorae]|uniref:DUF3419 family protein n=1 Tax=Algirhabdus cladophorae TaxID=3377108 RepID=UPI003B846B01